MRTWFLVTIAVALLAMTAPDVSRGALMAIPADQAPSGLVGKPSSGPALNQSRVAQTEVVSPSGSVSQAGWLTYHNPVTGLSFRYPPSLRIEERSPRAYAVPEPQEVTDLLGDTPMNPASIVLRFIVARGKSKPETAARKIRLMKEEYSGS